MRMNRFKFLIGVLAENQENLKVRSEVEKESQKIKSDFLKWKKELDNFLFYVDKKISNDKKINQLFYEGLDSIEAGEILIREKFGLYNRAL